MPPIKHTSLLLALACLGAFAAGHAVAQSAPDPLTELSTLRDGLRSRLDQRLKADAAKEAPRDVVLTLSPGLGKGPTKLTLRKQGDTWFAYGVSGLPEAWALQGVETTGITLENDRLVGPLVFTYTRDDLDEAAEEEAQLQKQTFQVDVPIVKSERQLVVTLQRSIAGEDWTLAFKNDNGAWVFDRELSGAGRLTSWGPFTRDMTPLKPDAEGKFSGEIRLTYTGKEPRLKEAYETHGHPVITFSGRMIEDRIDTTFVLKSPGGKHVLASGSDAVSGAVLLATATGKFHSKGDKGEWRGEVLGTVLAAPTNTAAIDTIVAGENADEAARAAAVYRQIAALDMALRKYPIPLQEAINRTIVPAPVLKDAKAQDATAYLTALVTHARALADGQNPMVPTGYKVAEDPTFGPYYGEKPLGDKVPAVGDGPQQWGWVGGWQMTGPFPLLDQDADVRAPEVLPVPAATFQRTRLFTSGKGEVEEIADTALWIPARIDRGAVAAPARSETSSGAQRYFTWYATTSVESDADQTVHAAMTLKGQALVWVNDALVWRSGNHYDAAQPTILKLPLKRGTNRILIRIASSRASNTLYNQIDWYEGYENRPQGRIDMTTFALHLCTQGKPDGKGITSTAVAPVADAPIGYRRDGSGTYPDATPPLAFDLQAGTNVAWRTPLAKGTADPVVRGNKVFVTAEPNTLSAVDLDTGKVLWKHDITRADAKPPAKPDTTASATPVADDKHVYATFGNGTAAAFTHDGTQAWVVSTGMPWNHPNMGSPLLVDGVLIVQGFQPAKDAKKDPQHWSLIGLDAATGKQLWTATAEEKRVHTKYDRAIGVGNGMALMRLANSTMQRALVITGDGVVIDAKTGETLHRDIFTKEANRAAPVVSGDVVYIAPVMGEEAVRLWLTEDGRVGAKTLWANAPAYGRGQVKTVTDFGPKHWMDAPVVDGDLLYVWRIDKAHVPQHHPVPAGQLEVFDTRTGSRIARLRRMTMEGTDPTVAPVIAGKFLFLGDGGDPVPGFHGTTQYGQLNVAELLRLPPADRSATDVFTATAQGALGTAVPAAKNRTTHYRANPVFAGDRMFLRTYDALICIRTTEAGKALETKQLAAVTFEDLLGPKPKASNVVQPQMIDIDAANKPPTSTLVPGRMPANWIALGPVPLTTEPDAAIKAFKEVESPWPEKGAVVKVGDTELTWMELDAAARTPAGDLNAFAATGGKQNAAGYFVTVLESNRAQTLVFEPKGAAATYWLSGKEIKTGDMVNLKIGSYLLVARVKIEKLPPFVKAMGFAPLFFPQQANTLTLDDWRARIRLLQGRLEHIAKALPNSDEAKRATALLNELNKPTK